MKVGKYIIRFWNFISTRGVSDDLLEENQMTRLLNRISTISVIAVIVSSVLMLLEGKNLIYLAIGSSPIIIFFAVPIFHHFQKIFWARAYISIMLPLWNLFSTLMVGDNSSQSTLVATLFVMTYFWFTKAPKLRAVLLIFNVALYLFAEFYLSVASPLIEIPHTRREEVIAFLLCIGWISIIFSVYEKERERYINNLQEKNRALERTTEELERFTYIASHDLKSPLRNVISFLGLAERKIEKREYEFLPRDLEFAKKGAEQMHYLISDILELSRINVNSRDQREWGDLNDIIEKSVSNLRQEITNVNADIHIPDLPMYFCNSVEFMLVFQNIIQNGIKYNQSETPTVNIRSEQIEKQLFIYFEDNGIGIEEQYFDRIFEFFKRLHTQKEYKGTGLGLGLCKKIIQNYNGDISVQSRVGEGSIFTIQLPHITQPQTT